MSKSPAFQFYPSDFLVGTMRLSTEEIGAYILLLCYQWDQGGIPADQEQCARIARCRTDAIASIWHKFGICEGSTVKNKRLEEERAKQTERREAQAANASKRWKNRKNDAAALPRQSHGNATALPRHTHGNAEPMPNACSSSSSSSSILPLSSPEGDNEPVTSLTETAEKKEGGPSPKTIASEAGVRILAMFDGASILPPVCYGELLEHVHNGTLPADEKKWRALEAMRAERAAIVGVPEDFDLRAAWLISKEAMCRKLGEALDVAFAKRPQTAPAPTERKKEDAPAHWQQKLIALYPNAHIPAAFEELPPEIRREVKGVA